MSENLPDPSKPVIDGSGDVTAVDGNLVANTAGKTLQIRYHETAACSGRATLVDGVAVVATTAVTAHSDIFVMTQEDNGTVGVLRVTARTAGVSFTITSSNGADVSVVAWVIFEPLPSLLPGKPTNLNLVSVSTTTIQISWTDSDLYTETITGYRVTYNGTRINITTGSPYTITGLSGTGTFVISVAATNANGTGTASDTISPVLLPGAPTDLVAEAGADPNTEIKLNWTAPTDGGPITRYDVLYNTGGGDSTFTGTDATTATVTGLSPGTTYHLRVIAVNASGSSAASNIVDQTTDAPAVPPDAPTIALVSDTGSGNILMTWSPNGAAADTYHLKYNTGGGDTVLDIAAPTTNYSFTGLTVGATYNFRISATNGAGTSADSSIKSAALVVNAAMTMVSVAAFGPPGFVLATWSDLPADALVTQLNLYYNEGGADTVDHPPGPPGPSNTPVVGLVAGHTYHFRITATNSYGESVDSNIVDYTA